MQCNFATCEIQLGAVIRLHLKMAALPHHHCAHVRTLDFQGKAVAQLAEHSDRLFCWFFIVLQMSFFTGLLIIVDANPIRGIRKGQFPYNYSLAR